MSTTLPYRYEKLGYAAINVTNLDRSINFYENLMGLELVEKTKDKAYLRCSTDHHNLILYHAERPGLKRVANKMEKPDDLTLAYEFLAEKSMKPFWVDADECVELNQGPSFRVVEPQSGVTFEFYAQMTHMADPYCPKITKIARIGHVVVGSPNYKEAVENLNKIFNFAISDFVADKFTWMRCFPNPLHHTFAIGRSNQNHLHHINFMVSDIDDIGSALNRLKNAGVEIVFGPGRHLPSTSIFLYFLDPDGMTMEFSFGMELLNESNGRLPRMLEMNPRTMDIWGSSPQERFGKHGDIEALHV
jgi:2,3-dihydroxy-p-cumate/2,3-dihydroxybenzoate 3,4-dioxygenase